MDYAYDQVVRNDVLLEGEEVLQLLTPNKKTFSVYRETIPAIVVGILFVLFAISEIAISLAKALSLSNLAIMTAGILAILIVGFVVNHFIQKLMYARKAYYITNKRILFVGGCFSLAYITLLYPFIGSVLLEDTLFSSLIKVPTGTISLVSNIDKRMTIKFFTVSGYVMPFLENAGDTYKLLVSLSGKA